MTTRSRRRRLSLLACASLTLAGCADLPLIDPGTCGNRVVEPDVGEDCDGQDGCGAPGSPRACRYTCDLVTGTACPSGSGTRCGVDGICRQHEAGAFEPMLTLGTVPTRDLIVGDLDADGCSELLHTTLQGTDVTAFASHAPGFCVASEQLLRASAGAVDQPQIYPAPLLADLALDGRPDLVEAGPGLLGAGLFVSSPGVGALLSPLLYPSAQVHEPGVRPLAANLRGQDVLLLFLSSDGGPGGPLEMDGGSPTDGSVAVAALLDPLLKPQALAGSLEGSLAGIVALQAADLDSAAGPADDRCDEVIVALAGAPGLQLYRVCGPDGAVGFTALPDVALDSGAVLRAENGAVAVVDWDGDGNPDLVTNAGDEHLHIAYGLGDGRFHSSPPPWVGAPDQRTSVLPTTDARLSSQDNIFVAGHFSPGAAPELAPVSCPAGMPYQSPVCLGTSGLCEAVVADVDRDGFDDIVATQGQQPGLSVLRSDGGGGFHPSSLDTQCPAHHLAAGDFDDDGVMDVAFVDQSAASSGEPVTAVRVAYGNAFAAPSSPQGGALLARAVGLASGRFESGASGQQLFAARQLSGSLAGLSLVEGHSGRQMLSPFYFPADADAPANLLDVGLVAVAAGRFGLAPGVGAQPGLAVITADPDLGGSHVLWRLTVGNDVADLGATRSQVTLPTCASCVLTALPLDADGPDHLLLLGDEAVVYEATKDGFVEQRRTSIGHQFRAVNDPSDNLTSYTPRPLVADLDGDGHVDVVARATSGALVALWGTAGGSFEPAELIGAPTCTHGASCEGQALALLDTAPDGSRGVAVLTAAGLALYTIPHLARTLVPVPVTAAVSAIPGASNFAALGAADFDGDGVTDLAIMASTTFITVLRGVPVRE